MCGDGATEALHCMEVNNIFLCCYEAGRAFFSRSLTVYRTLGGGVVWEGVSKCSLSPMMPYSPPLQKMTSTYPSPGKAI